MATTWVRTSMALDHWTLKALDELARRWGVSKAEVMRRGVRKLKEEADNEANQPTPLEALDWLQKGGGLNPTAALAFREQVRSERNARKSWWEE